MQITKCSDESQNSFIQGGPPLSVTVATSKQFYGRKNVSERIYLNT